MTINISISFKMRKNIYIYILENIANWFSLSKFCIWWSTKFGSFRSIIWLHHARTIWHLKLSFSFRIKIFDSFRCKHHSLSQVNKTSNVKKCARNTEYILDTRNRNRCDTFVNKWQDLRRQKRPGARAFSITMSSSFCAGYSVQRVIRMIQGGPRGISIAVII